MLLMLFKFVLVLAIYIYENHTLPLQDNCSEVLPTHIFPVLLTASVVQVIYSDICAAKCL